MNSDALFGRTYKIQIKDLDVSALRCIFKIKRSLRPTPNTAELSIYNLSPDHRRLLEGLPERGPGVTLAEATAALKFNPMLLIEAGYQGDNHMLYLGEVRAAHSVREGGDVVSKLTSGDGEKDMQMSRINVPIGPKTTIDFALTSLVRALGIGEGNLKDFVSKVRLSGAAEMYSSGAVLSGSAAAEMDAFCKAANLEWSIANGKLLLLDRSAPLDKVGIKLSADTGLVGSPSIDNQGIVSFKTLIIPHLIPGRLVVFDAEDVKGTYRVDDCTYIGDTEGQDWYIECKAALPNTAVVKHKGKVIKVK